MKVQNFITDVDGVIIDRMQVYTRIFSELLSGYGIDPEEAQRHYLHTAGSSIAEQFAELLKNHKIPCSEEQLRKLVNNFFHIASESPAPLFSGVRETFLKIKQADVHIFATSGSRTSELETLFKRNEIPHDLIMGSDQIPKGEAHLLRFAQFVGVALPDFCKTAAYLGDGPHDMMIATQHNILAIGISNTVDHAHLRKAGADVVIARIEEVVELLEI